MEKTKYDGGKKANVGQACASKSNPGGVKKAKKSSSDKKVSSQKF